MKKELTAHGSEMALAEPDTETGVTESDSD